MITYTLMAIRRRHRRDAYSHVKLYGEGGGRVYVLWSDHRCEFVKVGVL